MRSLPGGETAAATLKHPFMLAGVAVVVLLGLTAATLVVIDSARGDGAEPSVIVDEVTTTTPGPVGKTAIASGVRGTTKTTTAVRYAPGVGTPVLGTLPRRAIVNIDARSEDTGWLRILFPPTSELHGWVDVDDIDLVGDVNALAVATAEPPELVEVPTEEPITPAPAAPTVAPPPPPPPPVPDLFVAGSVTAPDTKQLTVSVGNRGGGVFKGVLVVAVFNAEQSVLLGGMTILASIEVGQTVDVATGFTVTHDQMLLLIVDPNGDIAELDNTNNSVAVAVTGPAPSPAAPPPPPPSPGAPPPTPPPPPPP